MASGRLPQTSRSYGNRPALPAKHRGGCDTIQPSCATSRPVNASSLSKVFEDKSLKIVLDGGPSLSYRFANSNRLSLAEGLVEDVVTSGDQLIESAAALRSLGALVSDALCVIDREAGGAAMLAKVGITLHSPFRMAELKATAA